MGLPSDFDKQTTVTISLLVWIAIVSCSMGMIYKSIIDGEKERNTIKDYVKQEVDGLRSDWERDRKEQNRRLIKLEK